MEVVGFIDLTKKMTPQQIDQAWYHTVLKIIGHNFDEADDICGLVVSVRDGHKGKLSLWIKDATNNDTITSLGRQFKEFSRSQYSVEFQSHETAKNRGQEIDMKL